MTDSSLGGAKNGSAVHQAIASPSGSGFLIEHMFTTLPWELPVAEGSRACSCCGVTQQPSNFAPRRQGGEDRQSWCRRCFAEANADSYRRDPVRSRERARRNTKLRAIQRQACARHELARRACVDCGSANDLSYDPPLARTALLQRWDLVASLLVERDVRCASCREVRLARKGAPTSSGRGRTRTMPYQPIGVTSELRRCHLLRRAESPRRLLPEVPASTAARLLSQGLPEQIPPRVVPEEPRLGAHAHEALSVVPERSHSQAEVP